MSKLDKIQALIERGVNQFIAICTNANRDLPFHDYHKAEIATSGNYVVGSDNINGTGDQKKVFVSKSTLLFSTQSITVKFNSANNVDVELLANTYYRFESNIHSIFWYAIGGQDDYMKMWFEGVMYHEARRPE